MNTGKVLMGTLTAAALMSMVAASPAEAQYRRRGGYGGAVAAGVIGGLAVGALIAGATRPAYGYGSGYGSGYGYGYGGPTYVADPYYAPAYPRCYRTWQPVYDSWGRYAGERRVKVCE